MLCLRCKCEKFYTIPKAYHAQFYKGCNLWVRSPGSVCKNCGWQTVGIHQIDILLRKTARTYANIKRQTPSPKG